MKNPKPICILLLGLLCAVAAHAQSAAMTCTKIDGPSVTFRVQASYEARPMALGWRVSLPAGWAYVSGQGEPEVTPAAGQTKELEWAHIEVPERTATFSFTVRYSGKAAGPHLFKAEVILQDAAKSTAVDLEPVQVE